MTIFDLFSKGYDLRPVIQYMFDSVQRVLQFGFFACLVLFIIVLMYVTITDKE